MRATVGSSWTGAAGTGHGCASSCRAFAVLYVRRAAMNASALPPRSGWASAIACFSSAREARFVWWGISGGDRCRRRSV